jgi:hypothetical protein
MDLAAIMTRSKTRTGEWGVTRGPEGTVLMSRGVEPPQFTRVTFPVKALKLLLHDLQTNGDAATMAARTAPIDAASDDSVSVDLFPLPRKLCSCPKRTRIGLMKKR